jgi:hypothetical protein
MFLSAWKDCFDGGQVDGRQKEEFLTQLGSWKEAKSSFEELLKGAEAALSPRQLLDERPLNSMAGEIKEWLGKVIHTLYCKRTGIREEIEQLWDLLRVVDETIWSAEKKMKGETVSYEVTGDNVIRAVTKFSEAISELPHEIQIL